MSVAVRTAPFPHAVLDGFASRRELAEANACWPAPGWAGWVRYEGERGDKLASRADAPVPFPLARLLARAAALPVGTWLSMPDSVPDLTLWGGGLHEMFAGGRLPPHLDADGHPRLGLLRAWSAVLYVHQSWSPGDGGELLLHGPSGVEVRIDPAPGRLAAFDCRAGLHEVARLSALAAPRRSLALFGYLPRPSPGRRPRAGFIEVE
jgi:hypothetical protein